MASLNRATLIGNACKPPEVRYTASGTAVASLSIATNEKWKDKSGEWVEKAEFHNVTFWGKLADIVGEYVTKGQQIFVEGRLQTRKWQDKDGNDRYTTEIVAEKMLMLGSGKGKQEKSSSQQEEPPFMDDGTEPF